MADHDALIGELDVDITRCPRHGHHQHGQWEGETALRPLHLAPPGCSGPAPRKIENRTVGRVFTTPDGKSYRPSMFLTLTCNSYGKVRDDGTPVNPTRTTPSGPPGMRCTIPR